MGHHIQVWLNRDDVLELFGQKVKQAQTHYRKFVSKGINEKKN